MAKVGTKEYSIALSIAHKKRWASMSSAARKKLCRALSNGAKAFYKTKRGKKLASKAVTVQSNYMKQLWQDPSYRRKMCKIRKRQFTPEVRAKISACRAKQKFPFNGTGPEKLVKEFLRNYGIKFSSQFRPKSCPVHSFDFCLHELRILVEVDGCYWHGCPVHYPKRRKQLKSALARERECEVLVREDGWEVVRLWEHEVNNHDFSKLVIYL